MLLSNNTFPDDPNMLVKTLFTYQPDTKMEMFEIELTHHHQQLSEPHAVGVVEHIVVLRGELGLYVEGEWRLFSEGERYRFAADQDHGYRAESESVTFQNIVCYT